jgi:hypothetical protein
MKQLVSLRKLSRIFAALAVLGFTFALLASVADGSVCFRPATGFLYLDYRIPPTDNGGTLILYDHLPVGS